jgi:ankyrin repeat protein
MAAKTDVALQLLTTRLQSALDAAVGQPGSSPAFELLEGVVREVLLEQQDGKESRINVNDVRASSSRSGGSETILSEACRVGRISLVEALLQISTLDVNTRVREVSPLLAAAAAGHTAIVRALLSHHAVDLQATDETGAGAVWLAISNRHQDTALALLEVQTPPLTMALAEQLARTTYGDGETCLFRAVAEGLERVVEMLLASHNHGHNNSNTGVGVTVGSILNLRCTARRMTALHVAIARRRGAPLVSLLLRHPDLDVNSANAEGITPLMQAVALQQDEVVDLLLQDTRTRPNLVTPNGSSSALLIAAAQGSAPIVDVFARHAASSPSSSSSFIDWNDARSGETPFRAAAAKGHLDVCRKILSIAPTLCIDVNAADTIFDMSPLAVAAEMGHTDIVRALLQAPSSLQLDVNRPSFGGRTPLHLALLKRHNAIVQLLLEDSRTDLNAVITTSGATPIWLAAHAGDLALCQQLLQQQHQGSPRVRLDARVQGASCFWIACQEGHLPVVQLIVEEVRRRARHSPPLPDTLLLDLSLKNDRHASALHVACARNHIAVVDYLLEAVPEIDVTDKADRTTVLLDAAARDHDAILLLLLEKRPLQICNIVNEPLAAGKTALWLAAARGSARAVAALLQVSATDPNVTDHENGWTPLHVAVLKQHYDVVAALLKAASSSSSSSSSSGVTAPSHPRPVVDPNKLDNAGFAPLDVAVHQHDVGLVKLLLRHRVVRLTRVALTLAEQHQHAQNASGTQTRDPIVALVRARAKKDREMQLRASRQRKREGTTSSQNPTPASSSSSSTLSGDHGHSNSVSTKLGAGLAAVVGAVAIGAVLLRRLK